MATTSSFESIRARAVWRTCLASAFRTALACSIVGVATLFGPESFKIQVAFPAFSYVTVILIVTNATLGDTLRSCWLALYATIQGVCPAILSLWLIGPGRLTASVAVALSAFVIVLPEKTHLIAKRIALGQLVIVYVIAYINGAKTEPIMHPVRVAASTAVGVVACVLALLLPYPNLACCEVKEKSKLFVENATERINLFVKAFSAEDNTSALALISKAKSLVNNGPKLLQAIKSKQESMKWERFPFKFLRPYGENPGDKFQEIQTPLRGMEIALENSSSIFPISILNIELKDGLEKLGDHISKQINNMSIDEWSATVPESNAHDAEKFLQTLQLIQPTKKDLPSLFFLFCLKLLLHKPTFPLSSKKGVDIGSNKQVDDDQEGFVKKTWNNLSMTINSRRFMTSFRCSLSLGLAIFFGSIYSKENGFWAGLPVAISLAATREATFKVANVKAQGTVLGTVYGVLGCFLFEKFVQIRFLSLLPWFIVSSFLSRSRMGEDGFMLFKNLCKLSMKFSSQEHADDNILLRGKVLSLELLKVIMDNAGPIWRSNERFLNVIKQFLCLSLLKNSALSVMTIFQLLCSIFKNLLSKYRSGLKSEIGIFFPMLILRVLENVLQPSFLQKMTVLGLLEEISKDPQIIIDVFVNYDCDVDAPNIFERTVNGLLKTALGPPPGSTTTLSPVQDITFRSESVKCLVTIIKSMGMWMDQQLKVGDPNQDKVSDHEVSEAAISVSEEGNIDYELHPDANSEFSGAAALEQRRAHKLEIQKGVSLFNRKPSKGIDFLMSTKKIGNSPEDVASFLKNTTGLNPTIIGDYLGEREEFPLKVMHAYVDSFNFEGMNFGESIRYFLRGFRLPGEAQKIDRIMEKFAERFCKCNPNSFTSADTAYVLAYSVIMLNTDAHNSMVKDKMTKADFIRNNRGIDDGKDLPEDYLGALYDQIVRNEIKMKADSSVPQNKQGNSLNKLLGLDGILNLVWKQREEKPLGANGVLVRHIQEQFKVKSGKSESVYYVIADPAILRFMVEVCWGPMLAAFSVTLDQSDDKNATSQCLLGFRHAVHITAVMGMQTQRDAFVTSMAKFTNLHCAADMKQKNVDTMKTIMSIAIEDGNHLHEAWEHILTCLSRFEHLQLLGEGAPSDSSFFTSSGSESEEKTLKSAGFPSLKKKGTLQNPTVAAVVRGGSYDSAAVGANSPTLVTPEQINNFISNLNLLDQIGNFELNHIFAHSQRLNSEAIVAFVKALCKVSMSELQSPTDPRVFSLTKIVEVAHYNMNRIRLVWSHIWSVLSEFFVAVGLSENLSVAIFVMDSLRQLAMKFLEREELANYNFQNEFLRPFVIVMQQSNSAEIRELIVRCISQMVLSRVNNVKSGWKSVFMVFTAAAADERKNIVLLAFETMEKIVREYFRYITETEALTFTDCVRCLITFTNSRFNSDVSLNAIAFLRFCAVKLAEGGLVSNEKNKNNDSSIPVAEKEASDGLIFTDKDDYMSFWEPLLTGLSRLTSDPRSAIRKSALEVLFNILKDHGHLFPCLFWINVFKSVIYPIFSPVNDSPEAEVKYDQSFKSRYTPPADGCLWDSETSVVAAQCLVDLFVNFFDIVRSELPSVVSIMVGFIKGSGKDPAATGVASVMRLAGDLRGKFCEEEWEVIFLALKEASYSTLPNFQKLLRTMDNIEISISDMETSSGAGLVYDESDDDNLHTAGYVVSRMKDHIAAQLRIIQVSSDLYKMCRQSISVDTVTVLLGIYSAITSHAQQLKSEKVVQVELQKACSILEIPEPPLVIFENESYQNYLNFLHELLVSNPSFVEEKNIEPELVGVCEEILRVYLECAGLNSVKKKPDDKAIYQWNLPLGSAKKEELVARTPLVLSVLRILCSWQMDSFRKYISQLFPLMIDLVRSEHSSGEVQIELSHFFQSCIGPIIMKL